MDSKLQVQSEFLVIPCLKDKSTNNNKSGDSAFERDCIIVGEHCDFLKESPEISLTLGHVRSQQAAILKNGDLVNIKSCEMLTLDIPASKAMQKPFMSYLVCGLLVLSRS